MLQRREIWKRLKPEEQNFVISYLSESLGLKTEEHENFLFPDFEKNLLDARAMTGMTASVDRILKAVKLDEKICVYGDYDCDGVPGTALLRDFFEKINYHNTIYYIPHRHTEGYGLNNVAIQKLKDEGVSLIITIDLGTTNITEIDFANTLGIDVIVTDHHLPVENEDGQILPKAYAIINNKQNSCNYANKDLCGSSTVYKLVVELLRELREIHDNDKSNWSEFEKKSVKLPQVGYEKWLLDLVAIATIADMVPLTNENRTLAIYGLHVLGKTNRGGLQALFKNAKVDLKKINETDIAFSLAPRINSASRMAHPKIALSMFSQDLKEGIDAAHELEDLNSKRKSTTQSIVKKISKILDERIESSKDKKLPEIVVIGNSEWNAGVLGILAQKILEKYNVDVFVWGGEDEEGKKTFKGSCRSRGDIHLVKLMSAVKEKFLHFGGHELAGGFSVSFDHVHDLEKVLNENIVHAKIEHNETQNDSKNVLNLNLEKVDAQTLLALNLIGPFGVGNPKPVFNIQNVKDVRSEKFGKNKEHLKLKLKNDQTEIEAIKFFVEHEDEEKILENFRVGKVYFEIEPGFMSSKPRLKIVDSEMV
jgi:single-stranded-DNA-specific exonuclease